VRQDTIADLNPSDATYAIDVVHLHTMWVGDEEEYPCVAKIKHMHSRTDESRMHETGSHFS